MNHRNRTIYKSRFPSQSDLKMIGKLSFPRHSVLPPPPKFNFYFVSFVFLPASHLCELSCFHIARGKGKMTKAHSGVCARRIKRQRSLSLKSLDRACWAACSFIVHDRHGRFLFFLAVTRASQQSINSQRTNTRDV